ncbi:MULTISPECIES: hypothetical protein [Cyanophyceae]|uniref:Helix-turn-helix domain-containing protein n=1 Tax=Leptolyngbya subtilissima DQ-A4 TaxID=2933933 RepID=A0ABV0KC32_9CYAN|nr:hypothetical protein [Nodosilinea sp. FACHB-141]MBD2115246.1 hypothetical protein [Nodosilinea sp. FACHB-141]
MNYIENNSAHNPVYPAPGPDIRPDRQEPEPVPRDLIPREWLENKRMPGVLAHGVAAMTVGPAGLTFLMALHYWMPRSKNIHDGKIWVYNTLETWCGYAGLPIGTLRRTIQALINLGIVETWRPSRRQPVRYSLNYPRLHELAKTELVKAGYWPTPESDQIDHTQTAQSDQPECDHFDHTQTPESDQNDQTQNPESDHFDQTIQENNSSQENSSLQDNNTRSGCGGEILNGDEPGEAQQTGLPAAKTPAPEPARNRKPEQRRSPVAPPVQSKTGLANDRNPVGDRSSAADFSAAEEILNRAERELGDRIGARRELARFAPQALQEALDATLHERDGSPADAVGMFVKKAREKQTAIAEKLELQASQEDAKRLAAQLYAEHDRLLIPLQERKVIQNPAFRRIAVYTLHDIVKRPEEAQAYLAWLQEQPTPAPVDWSLEAEAWDDEEQEQAAGSAGAALVWEILAQSRTRAFPAAAQAKAEPVATCRVPVG